MNKCRLIFLSLSLAGLALTFVFTSEVVTAQKYIEVPVTKDRLIRVVRSKQFAVPNIVKRIQTYGVDFELTPSIEDELRSARAHQQVIDAVRDNYRYAGQKQTTANRKPAPVRDTDGERYDQLYYQGLSTFGQLQTATSVAQAQNLMRSVIDTGNQAIRLKPERPEGYTLVAAGNLMLRNFNEAERYAQFAVDRGGNLAFPVFHLKGTPHIEILHVGSGYVTVESEVKNFQFFGGEITNLQRGDDYQMQQGSVAVFGMATNKNGFRDMWYFTPANTGTTQEAEMIMRLIQKNIGR